MKFPARFPAAALCRILLWGTLVLVLLPLSLSPSRAEEDETCAECTRRQRKVLEALQAWRRAHDGEYPRLLRELEDDGFITPGSLVCPAMAREQAGGSSHHGLVTARGPDGDVINGYEYELAPSKLPMDEAFHVNGKPPTRRDIKSGLLRKPFWEQVPILRCAGHRKSAPPHISGDKAFRNLTADGRVYWSEEVWENEWNDQVPTSVRGAISLNEENGPTFHSGKDPLEGSLDLRPWVNACPRVPWWWGSSAFDYEKQIPDLKIFLKDPGRFILEIGDQRFPVDGIVQTQGLPRVVEGNRGWSFAAGDTFPYERRNLPVKRKIRRAVWLQGTAWSAKEDRKVADLVWRYEDGTSCEVPVVYMKNVWRFNTQEKWYLKYKPDLAEPALSVLVPADPADPNPNHDIRYTLWTQIWDNPKPETPVATLDLIGNPNCTAGLFIASILVE